MLQERARLGGGFVAATRPAEGPRQCESRFEQVRVGLESRLQPSNRTDRIVAGQGEKPKVGFDHRIPRFELASDLEGVKRASYIVGAAAAIGERKAGVGRWNSSRQRHLEVRFSAIAAPTSDLGISKAKARLRILGVVADDGLQASKERITPHFP